MAKALFATGIASMRDLFPLIPPDRLFSRAEVLQRPSPVPRAFGLYAWYFQEVPMFVPTDGCSRKSMLFMHCFVKRRPKLQT